MFCKKYAIAGTSGVALAEMIESDIPEYMQSLVGVEGFRSDIILQAPAANGADIYFGDSTDQEVFIQAGGSSGLFKTELNNLYIKGTPGDEVIVFLAL